MRQTTDIADVSSQFERIQQAATLIAPYAINTPVLRSDALDNLAGAKLYFKCEHRQQTGAFKFRGAMHALLQLSEAERAQGVYTVSSGNHGAALACAGQLLNTQIEVAVPTSAPAKKQQNIARYQPKITSLEPGMAAREAFVAQQRTSSPAHFIPPYDHPHIIQGQGTAALELLQAQPDLQVLIAPLGGGGLLSGTCLTGRALGVQAIYGAEPELANDAYESLQQGRIQPAKPPKSVCDGLLTSLGQHTFQVLTQHLTAVLVITDEETLAAQALIKTHLGEQVEPSAAITLAAVLKNPEKFQGKHVGLILSGGNT